LHLTLEIPSAMYFLGAMLPKRSMASGVPAGPSPFTQEEGVVKVMGFKQADIAIQDGSGNVTGIVDGVLVGDIPGSLPVQVRNGSETPPYGYLLSNDSYILTLDSAGSERMGLTLYTGNRLLSYERWDAASRQTDRIIYHGGMMLANSDPETKSVRFLSIVSETTRDKCIALRGLTLAQADSMSIDNTDSSGLVFRSLGPERMYDLEINLTSASGMSRFVAYGMKIGVNSGHTILPDWSDLEGALLTIYVDHGNDGDVDDTLRVSNGATGSDDLGSLPVPFEYSLAQNYPNPFNSSTTIGYGLPRGCPVLLTLYNTVGQCVATLVQQENAAGYHEVKFDASGFSSGVYFYRLQAGGFVHTRKLLLLR
jgi:hypothetical protein